MRLARGEGGIGCHGRQWLDSNHPKHCPRAYGGCQTSKSGIKGIIPFNSITYEIINRVGQEIKLSSERTPKARPSGGPKKTIQA